MSNLNFEVGDIVECVNAFDAVALNKGTHYKVHSIDDHYLYLRNLNGTYCGSGGWKKNRFKKVTEEGLEIGHHMRNIELED